VGVVLTKAERQANVCLYRLDRVRSGVDLDCGQVYTLFVRLDMSRLGLLGEALGSAI
jgi:hypothetical protein